jgi:hypothetical protein
MMDVTIKQDVKDEVKEEGGKEGANPNWPWPDLPLPKDFYLLPAHSQVHLTDNSYPISISAVAHFCRNSSAVPAHPTKIPTLQSLTEKQANTNVLTLILTTQPQ